MFGGSFRFVQQYVELGRKTMIIYSLAHQYCQKINNAAPTGSRIPSSTIQKIDATKGQLISKCLFGIFNSPKTRTKKIDFTTMVPQVELF